MATKPSKEIVARWASALTLGQPHAIKDDFNTKPFFGNPSLRIHYAATFNGATAIQIHELTPYSWICCVQPNQLAPISTGKELVALVEQHLTDQLKTEAGEALVLPLPGGAA